MSPGIINSFSSSPPATTTTTTITTVTGAAGVGEEGILSSMPAAKGIRPTPRASFVHDNVWEWIHDTAEASPVKPISNLGTGFNEHHAPAFLIREANRAVEIAESNQYAPITGLPKLKEAISQIYSPLYGRKLDPRTEILVTNGAQEAALSSIMTFVGPGDEVILMEPVFQMYEYQVTYSGAKICYVPLRPPVNAHSKTLSGNDWTIDLEELKAAITPRTKMVVVNNPHNPLGKVFTRAELQGIGDLCVKHNILVLSDEVYQRVVFDDPAHCMEKVPFVPMASLSPAIARITLTTVSFGKLFNVTGWRLGFVTGSPDLIGYVTDTHHIMAYSSTAPAQEACSEALLEADRIDWWAENARDISTRMRTLCRVLDDIGLNYVAPAGAWFVFVDINRLQIPPGYRFPTIIAKDHDTADWRACYFLVQEVGVSTIPGSCFYGAENLDIGASYLRMGACKNDEGLALARERLLRLKPFILGDTPSRVSKP